MSYQSVGVQLPCWNVNVHIIMSPGLGEGGREKQEKSLKRRNKVKRENIKKNSNLE